MARLSDRNKELSLVPVPQSPDTAGFIKETADDIIPTGWLECDGSAVSRSEYSELFEKIGTTYGSGDGSTTFNVPNETSAYDAVNMTVIIKAHSDASNVSIGAKTLTTSSVVLKKELSDDLTIKSGFSMIHEDMIVGLNKTLIIESNANLSVFDELLINGTIDISGTVTIRN